MRDGWRAVESLFIHPLRLTGAARFGGRWAIGGGPAQVQKYSDGLCGLCWGGRARSDAFVRGPGPDSRRLRAPTAGLIWEGGYLEGRAGVGGSQCGAAARCLRAAEKERVGRAALLKRARMQADRPWGSRATRALSLEPSVMSSLPNSRQGVDWLRGSLLRRRVLSSSRAFASHARGTRSSSTAVAGPSLGARCTAQKARTDLLHLQPRPSPKSDPPTDRVLPRILAARRCAELCCHSFPQSHHAREPPAPSPVPILTLSAPVPLGSPDDHCDTAPHALA